MPRRPKDGAFLRFLLAAAGLLRRPLRLAGVDWRPFREILETKLRLDLRRTRLGADGEVRVGAASKMGLFWTCVVYLGFGLFLGIGTVLLGDPFLAMSFAQGVLLVMLGVALVSDFTSVLLDPTDLSVLGAQPVSDRTLLAARVVHVALYLGLLAVSLGAGSFVFGTIRFGPAFGAAFLLATVLTSIEAVFGAVVLYLVAMRLFRPGRVRDAIVWFQIGATVVLVLGYQLLPRALEVEEHVGSWIDRNPALVLLVPPFHAGGLAELCLGAATPRNLLLAACAVALPALLLWAAIRLGTRGFVAGLAALEAEDGAGFRAGGYGALCARLLARGGVRRAGFDFFRHLARRERLYRLRVYPMLAVALVLGIVPLFSGLGSIFIVAPLYYGALFVPTGLLNARYTETPEAAWILDALPLADRRGFHAGALRAFLACQVLPVLAVLFWAVLLLSGFDALPHAVFAAAAFLVAGLAATLHVGRRPFFAAKHEVVESAAGCMLFAVMGVVMAPFGAVHMAFFDRPLVLLLAAAAALAPAAFLLRAVDRIEPKSS